MKQKRNVSLIISLVMIMTLLVGNLSIVNASSFKDVKGNEFYADAAENLFMRGILSGYADGEFKPEKTITRAEMAKLVCVMQGDIALNNIDVMMRCDFEVPFDDIDQNHWAFPYIVYASEIGIINGYVDGTFKPEKNVLYEEAVKMIVCALGFDRDVVNFEDDWAKGYLGLAEGYSITKDSHCKRGEEANRSSVAVMIYNSVKGIESGFPYTGDIAYLRSYDYEDDNYEDDSYKDDSYKDDNYEDDSYKDDSYKDDSYEDDSYKDDSYEDDSYEDDSYEDDSYEDDSYEDDYYEPDYGIRGNGEYLLTFEKSNAGVIEGDAGYYKVGDKIKIKSRAGKDARFMSWTSDNGGEFFNVFKSETTFTMPANDVVIKASYISDYGNDGTDDSYESDRLDQYDGQNINLNKYVQLNLEMIGCGSYRNLSGPYHPGQVVELSIGAEDEDIFLGWSSNNVELPTPYSPKCKIIIPDHDVTVTATFSE